MGAWVNYLTTQFKDHLVASGLKTVDHQPLEKEAKWNHAYHVIDTAVEGIVPADQIPMALYGVTALKWSDRRLVKQVKHFTEKR
jgi:hypothetical protein